MLATRVVVGSVVFGMAAATMVWLGLRTSPTPAPEAATSASPPTEPRPTQPVIARDHGRPPSVDPRAAPSRLSPPPRAADRVDAPSNASNDHPIQREVEQALAALAPDLRRACLPDAGAQEVGLRYAMQFDAEGALQAWAVSAEEETPAEIMNCLAQQSMDLEVAPHSDPIAVEVPLTLR